MSTTAQSRDLSDPQDDRDLRRVVQTMERLKLLLVLTDRRHQGRRPRASGPAGRASCCAPSTTRPRSCWPAAIPSSPACDRVRLRAGRAPRRARRLEPTDAFDAYAPRHYPAYWLKVDPAAQVEHARFVAARDAAGRDRRDRWSRPTPSAASPSSPCSRPTIRGCSPIITGACAAAGGNIVDAQIFTTTRRHGARHHLHLARLRARRATSCAGPSASPTAIERALKGEVKTRRSRRQPRGRARAQQDLPRRRRRSSSTTRCRTATP